MTSSLVRAEVWPILTAHRGKECPGTGPEFSDLRKAAQKHEQHLPSDLGSPRAGMVFRVSHCISVPRFLFFPPLARAGSSSPSSSPSVSSLLLAPPCFFPTYSLIGFLVHTVLLVLLCFLKWLALKEQLHLNWPLLHFQSQVTFW